MSPITSRDYRINAPGGRLFARRWDGADGARPDIAPIVLLHDSLGCVGVWREFPEQLAAATQRAVIAYDRLGFGQSDPYPGTLPLTFIGDEAATSFAAVREGLQFDRFVVFGHSVGGAMAVACAAACADACTALITESAQAFVEDRTIQGLHAARGRFSESGQIERLQRYHGEKAGWVLQAWLGTWLDPDFAGWRLDETLRRLRVPALVIHGDQDEFGSAQHARRIAQQAGEGSRLLLLKDCGHVPHRQMTGPVLDAVRMWLQDA